MHSAFVKLANFDAIMVKEIYGHC